VKLEPDLSEFNRRLAWAVREMFSDSITAAQCADGELHFRGPHPLEQSECTHAAVRVEREVLAVLDFATPLLREMMMRRLIKRLAAQLRAQYDRKRPPLPPLYLVVTPEMLDER